MGLTKERKIFFGVMAFALGGLIVDRFFFGATGGPASAKAEMIGESDRTNSPPRSDVSAAVPQVSAQQQSVAALAARLRSIARASAGSGSAGDAFHAPAPAAIGETVAPIAAEPPPAPSVTAVLVGPHPAAIAGGRRVTLGEQIGGWTVVAIDTDVVTFDFDGARVERRVR